MDTTSQDQQLRAALLSGAKTPKALRQTLQISQPTLSRAINRNRDTITSLGAGRSTLYAIARPLVAIGSELPVYQVDGEGSARQVGTLHVLLNGEYYWSGRIGHNGLLRQVPWFIENMRPEGFLGRAFAQHCSHIVLPTRLSDWSSDHLLQALAQAGSDLAGDLVVGKEAMNQFLAGEKGEEDIPHATQRETLYPTLAERALAGDLPGSSAGGEQPKFCIQLRTPDITNVLVKFSPPTDTIEGQRWADLILCEHLALQTMSEAGHSAARSQFFTFGSRSFLEVKRFDRIDLFGRRGVCSLGIVDGEFIGGERDSWHRAARQLHDDKKINSKDMESIFWQESFGLLIANTDQHFGNISFFTLSSDRFDLCPAYDMLPMFYRPSPSGEIVERYYQPPSAPPELMPYWDDVKKWAQVFWQKVVNHQDVSDSFKSIAAFHIGQNANGTNAKRRPQLIL